MAMQTPDEGFSDVSSCYVFKSQLQEYAQKAGLHTPEYETTKEGPSHEPSFKSTVIVNNTRYDSLPGFFNRKAAEQSAAEVALLELAKSREVDQSLSQPVHVTGLCKNLLQEYAQKANHAIPLYLCQKDDIPGRSAQFKCTVDIGGIQYIGASARTKKEAEINAARTALLAIRLSSNKNYDKRVENGNSQLTVLPGKKRGFETTVSISEEAYTTNITKKAKKSRRNNKGKKQKIRLSRGKVNCTQVGLIGDSVGSGSSGIKGIREWNTAISPLATISPVNGQIVVYNPLYSGYASDQVGVVMVNENVVVKEMNIMTGVSEPSSMLNRCILGPIEGLNDNQAGMQTAGNKMLALTGVSEPSSMHNQCILGQIEGSNDHQVGGVVVNETEVVKDITGVSEANSVLTCSWTDLRGRMM